MVDTAMAVVFCMSNFLEVLNEYHSENPVQFVPEKAAR